MEWKTCCRCGLKAGDILFEKQKNVCRPCERLRRADWRRRNASRLATEGPLLAPRACSRCAGVFPPERFSPSTARRDGLHSWCLVCVAEDRKTPEARALRNLWVAERRAAMTPDERRKSRSSPRQGQRRPQGKHDAHVAAYAREEKRRGRAARKAAREAERLARRLAEPHIPQGASKNKEKKLRRKRAIERATPEWACRDAIAEAYAAVAVCRAQDGRDWTADHIVPLRHPLVCGLHVANNLFPALRSVNSEKGNRYWPDMP